MKAVYLALGLLLLSGMLWAQKTEKENEFSMSMQIRPRAEYRNGALFRVKKGIKQLPSSIIVHACLWNTNVLI